MIVLASASPRRLDLLRQIGIEARVEPSRIEEIVSSDIPEEVVRSLSAQKCREVAGRTGDGIVIGADTVVVCGGRILGKPADPEEAFSMLRTLQGSRHQVCTGVTVIRRQTGVSLGEECFSVTTDVCVRAMTDREIRSYIETGEPMDKAGAYGIQGIFARHIDRIEGDYTNVVGLPLSELWSHIERYLK